MQSNSITYYFGFQGQDIAKIATSLADLLKIEWQYRESDMQGGDYCYYRDGEKSISLRVNNTEFLTWIAPNYTNYEFILKLLYSHGEIAPASQELLARFSELFSDAVFIPNDDLGILTTSKAFRISPIIGLQWLIVVSIKKILSFPQVFLRVLTLTK